MYSLHWAVLYHSPSPLEGIGTILVCDQESDKHPVSLDTKPNKETAAISNLYGGFLSSSTQNQNLNFNLI